MKREPHYVDTYTGESHRKGELIGDVLARPISGGNLAEIEYTCDYDRDDEGRGVWWAFFKDYKAGRYEGVLVYRSASFMTLEERSGLMVTVELQGLEADEFYGRWLS